MSEVCLNEVKTMAWQPIESGSASNANFGDVSQNNVYNASQGMNRVAIGVGDVRDSSITSDEGKTTIKIDQEVANLLSWLAKQQGISPELALKKAVATSAYVYDVTASQGGKLLVQRKDNSVGEIVLK